MADVTLKGNPVKLYGQLIQKGSFAPDFRLVNQKLETISLRHSEGKKRILSIFPSLDTSTCLKMNKHLDQLATKHPNILFYAISSDLPFAAQRICGLEKMNTIHHLSMMHNKQFGMDYGLLITSGPLEGLLARALIVIDEKNHIKYVQLVSEITQEPNYEELMKAVF